MSDSTKSGRQVRFLIVLVSIQMLAILMLVSDVEQQLLSTFPFPYDIDDSSPKTGLRQTLQRLAANLGDNQGQHAEIYKLLKDADDGPVCDIRQLLAESNYLLLHEFSVASGSENNTSEVVEAKLMTLARRLVTDLENGIDKRFRSPADTVGKSQLDRDVNLKEFEKAAAKKQLHLDRMSRLIEFTKFEITRATTKRKLDIAISALTAIVEQMNENRVVYDRPLDDLIFFEEEGGKKLEAWARFQNGMTPVALYPKNDSVVEELLEEMRSLPTASMSTESETLGTQMHMTLYLTSGAKVLFKPKRLDRDYERPIDVGIYRDIERHTAEIAAYHLDKCLGRSRVPPTVGRKFDFVYDIETLQPYNVTGSVEYSDDGHRCFVGVCSATCSPLHLICADDDDMLEGSLSAWFPSAWAFHSENPYKAICGYCENMTAWTDFESRFERNSSYCFDVVRDEWPFKSESMFLHLVDVQIFDFLTGNLDRHHLAHYLNYWSDSFIVLFDNGKGFGTSKRDDIRILAPLFQCCMVRLSTVERLLQFQHGSDRLSDLMRRSLATDDLDTILTEAHLAALDRRVAIVLDEVYNCTQRISDRPVIIDDGL